MHPIKRTLALMLTLSLSVSCLPSAALAVEEPASSASSASTPVVVDMPAAEDSSAPADTTEDSAETDSLPEQTPVAGNTPTTDKEVQEALNTFDPTIDDP